MNLIVLIYRHHLVNLIQLIRLEAWFEQTVKLTFIDKPFPMIIKVIEDDPNYFLRVLRDKIHHMLMIIV